MSDAPVCPKCGAAMDERPITTEDGTPLHLGGEGRPKDLASLVCTECGYAELHEAVETAGPTIPPDVSRIIGTDTSDPATARYVARVKAAVKARGRTPEGEPKDVSPLLLVAFAVSAALAIAGIVWLVMASGPVMEAGGFVASGGPYAIEHQAEDWIWLPTMGATLMMFAIVGNFFLAAALDRPAGANMLVFWTAIFGTMSFQFFKYGINAPGGGQSWGWIVCGVLFAAFSIPSAVMLFMRSTWRGFNGAYAWANALGALAGLGGGLWLWWVVAG